MSREGREKRKNRWRKMARRKPSTRQMRRTFLIVTEGTETEPRYFGKFQTHVAVTIKTIGVGSGPQRAVDRALKERDKAARNGVAYDEVWCVFDRDNIPAGDFNAAIQSAKRAGVDVAYSVPCFELWFLLHFQNVSGALPCKDHIKKLEARLSREYEKNQDDMYDLLATGQADALKRAENLEKQWPRSTSSPASCNPSTKVHCLVRNLLANRRP